MFRIDYKTFGGFTRPKLRVCVDLIIRGNYPFQVDDNDGEVDKSCNSRAVRLRVA